MEMIPASKKTPDGLFVDEENTEDLEDSKHIAFDLLFPMKNCVSEKVDIWCDIEAQNEYFEKSDNNKQSYDLVSRGVYYLSRMISRQLTSGGRVSGYGDLCKCYSIWICFDHLNDPRWVPTVTRYNFSPTQIIKGDSEPLEKERKAADLMELIIVRAGGNTDEKSLINFVNTLWRDTENLSEYIPNEYEGLNSITREVDGMCDLRVVWEKQARRDGEIKNAIKVVQSLLDVMPFDKALKHAQIDEETYNKYKDVFSSDSEQ